MFPHLKPKAVAAFFTPLVVTALGVLASWVTTGNFNSTEIRTAISGAILSFASLIGAYYASDSSV
jgi:hypothetical protein